MRKLIAFAVLAFLTANAQAQTLINFYIQENGEVDVVGSSNVNLTLPIGVEQQGSRIFGVTQQLTSKTGEIWSFNFSLDKEADVVMYLPKYASVELLSANAGISEKTAR